MVQLLDSQDNSVNAEIPMLQGLTNSGPANLRIGMNLPAYQPPGSTTTSGVFGTTPALIGDLNIEDDDEWSDTNPMAFDDDQIFESSAFLGIRIGKKAKARGVEKKAVRVAKREARSAAKNASVDSIGADSVWKQPNEVTIETYNPLAVAPENPAMLSTLNNVATTAATQLGLGNPNATGLTGFEELQNANYPIDSEPKPTTAKNNTVLYAGIAVAALVILIVALKAKK